MRGLTPPRGQRLDGEGDKFDKDRFDAYMKLAEFRRAIREGRRQFEFKMTATVYFALAGLSLYPKNIPIWLVVGVAVPIILVGHTLWVFWNFDRNESDRVQMYRNKGAAEELLTGQSRELRRLEFRKAWGSLFQIIGSYAIGIFTLAARLLN